MSPISILCVHGVGHGDADQELPSQWRHAIGAGIAAWAEGEVVNCDFLRYDQLFDAAPNNPATYAEAFGKLVASGVEHGIGDIFSRQRGLFELPERLRWTVGMVAQWTSDENLRQNAAKALLDKMAANNYDAVCAHSLGSLICYDTFLTHPQAIADKYFVSLGSQIGNPCVRNVFAGRLESLPMARKWFHLYNPNDHVLTAEIRIAAANFQEVGVKFDIPGDILNHDAIWYFNDRNTGSTAWKEISGSVVVPALSRGLETFRTVTPTTNRRALLVGINEYPDPENRLEGCVNDVFLMSSLLQECDFKAADIRVVLNERATARNILDRLHWLLDDTKPGDERVLFYSGHGAQIPVYGVTDEVDHLDECLVPYDFDWSLEHAVTDKQFRDFYSQLPYDSYFAAIFDCCHSGGMTREGGRKVRGVTPPDDIRHRAMQWNAGLGMWEERPLANLAQPFAAGDEARAYAGITGSCNRLGRAVSLRTLANKEYDRVRKTMKHSGPYLPVIMEACQENQLSYEYRHGVQSYGAFTFSLAAELRDSRGKKINPTFTQLMAGVTARLKKLKYDQTPNLVGAKTILGAPIPWSSKEQKRKTATGKSPGRRK